MSRLERGGVRSSDEATVMVVERRDSAISTFEVQTTR